MEYTFIAPTRLLTGENITKAGIAETRVLPLLRAADNLHSAVCQLSPNGKACLAAHFPEVLTVAQMYGQTYEWMDGLEETSTN
mgnify:CR=1 FL=1